MIKLTDKENLSTLTEIFMRDNGSMIRHMEKERILMPTEHTIMVIGSMINNTALVWNHGLMVPNMKETGEMEWRREEEATTKVNLNKMKFVVMESITGLMANSMMDSGVIIKCTAKEHLSGKTKRNIKVHS